MNLQRLIGLNAAEVSDEIALNEIICTCQLAESRASLGARQYQRCRDVGGRPAGALTTAFVLTVVIASTIVASQRSVSGQQPRHMLRRPTAELSEKRALSVSASSSSSSSAAAAAFSRLPTAPQLAGRGGRYFDR